MYEQVLKAGLRFPLSTLHRELLHYLGLSVTQISPNAWRVFIAMEILYGAMSDGERRLTVREFLHCYRPDEIDRSRGLYRFASRGPLLKIIFETPDSNRDWKSRYFFMEGDRWMNRPGETEYMPVDTTWGIINQLRMHPSCFSFFLYIRPLLCLYFDRLSLQVDGARRLASRNLVSLKRFAGKLSRRRGPGLS